MTEYQDERFLARWLNGELTESEQLAFEQSEDYAALTQVLAGVDQLEPAHFDPNAMLDRTKTRIRLAVPAKETPVSALRPSYWLTAIAAAVALLLLAVWLWPTAKPKSFATEAGKQIKDSFPDQSIFTLNAESQLAYDANSWSEERKVDLSGEAYFEVEKGQPFSVETPLGTVKVLGTRFNVYARGQVMEVSCYEGKVAVIGAAEPQTLTAGMSIRLTQQQEIQELQIPDEVQEPGWMQGIYNLQDVTLQRVVETLSSQYGVTFVTDSVDLNREGGAAFYGNNLETALKTAFESFELTYEQQGKVIVLTEKK